MIDVDNLVVGDASSHLCAARRAAQHALRTLVSDAPNGAWKGKEVEEYDGTEPVIINEVDISTVVDAATLEVLARLRTPGATAVDPVEMDLAYRGLKGLQRQAIARGQVEAIKYFSAAMEKRRSELTRPWWKFWA